MSLYFIEEQDEMELEDVAKAIDEAGFNVGAVRVRQALAEIARLKKIEAMAMACDGIDMGRHYEVPIDAWEALMSAVWDDMANVEFRPLDAALSRPVAPATEGYTAPTNDDYGQA